MIARRRPPRYSRWLIGAAAAIAVVLAVALPMQFFGADAVSPAAEVTATPGLPQTPLTGDGIPYLVLDEPSWDKVDVWMEGASGNVAFTTPESEEDVFVTWEPKTPDGRYSMDNGPANLTDRYALAELTRLRPESVTVFGLPGELRYGSGTFLLTYANKNTQMSVIGLDFAGRDDFYAAVSGLRQVTQEELFAEAPKLRLSPEAATAAAQEMMSDIEAPERHPVVVGEFSESTPYRSLIERVTATVGCAWVQAYQDAYQDHDEAGMAQAAQALQESQDWSVMNDPRTPEDWRDRFAETANALAGREDVDRADAFRGVCKEYA